MGINDIFCRNDPVVWNMSSAGYCHLEPDRYMSADFGVIADFGEIFDRCLSSDSHLTADCDVIGDFNSAPDLTIITDGDPAPYGGAVSNEAAVTNARSSEEECSCTDRDILADL